MGFRIHELLGAAVAALAMAFPSNTLAQSPAEYRIKAAFLFNFAKFADWPERSFAGPRSPIVIVALCPHGFASDLGEIVHGRRVNGRPFVVRELQLPADARFGHIVFACASHDNILPETLDAVRRLPVLTVGESELFAARGGMIRFVVVQDRVRFEIDMGAVERVGLALSAQLQKLAVEVRRPPERSPR